MNSQWGVGKKNSEGSLGDDDHGFNEGLFEVSCSVTASVRVRVRNCRATRNELLDNVK